VSQISASSTDIERVDLQSLDVAERKPQELVPVTGRAVEVA
jgi:hypothetical protein